MLKKVSIHRNWVSLVCWLLLSSGLAAQNSAKDAIVKSGLLFPPKPLHTHGSSVVSLPNGDLISCWFEGSGERQANDVKIMGTRLKKNSKEWSLPFLMADTYNLPDCNPVLFLNKNNKLFLVWIVVVANEWENSILKVQTSTNYLADGAPVWTGGDNIFLHPDDRFEQELQQKFKNLPKTNRGWSTYALPYDKLILSAAKDPLKRSIGWMTRIDPLVLTNGTIILPLYSDGYNLSLMAISEDDGATWKPGLPVAGRGNVQPSLVQKKNGTLVAYMRDNGDEPNRVQISESKDAGWSWTAATKTEIPNTASVKVLKLMNGNWALIVNDSDDGRYQLQLYLSDDEGSSWKWKYPLEQVPKGQGSFSYPAMIQTNDGFLYITYSYQTNREKGESIKYVVVNPKKITNNAR